MFSKAVFLLIYGLQLEQFRKQKAAKKAASLSTQPVDDKTVPDSDGDVAASTLFNGPPPRVETQPKSDVYNLSSKDVSKERGQQDESLSTSGFSSSLELRGGAQVVPFSNIDKQSSGSFDQSDGFPKGTSPFSETTLLLTSMQMHGISSRKGTFFLFSRMGLVKQCGFFL